MIIFIFFLSQILKLKSSSNPHDPFPCSISYATDKSSILFRIECLKSFPRCRIFQKNIIQTEYTLAKCGENICNETCGDKIITDLQPFTPYHIALDVFSEKNLKFPSLSFYYFIWTKPVDIIFNVTEIGATYAKFHIAAEKNNSECRLYFAKVEEESLSLYDIYYSDFQFAKSLNEENDLICANRTISDLKKNSYYVFALRSNVNGGIPHYLELQTSKNFLNQGV